ncbi:MAG: hypothetical protein HQK83_03455 [Fibrobacteria bacterium]|nr:hypothetical protein [Fibrobacteria bacterium]
MQVVSEEQKEPHDYENEDYEEPLSDTDTEAPAPVIERLVSLQDIVEKWQELISELMDKQPLIAGYFLETQVLLIDGDPTLLRINFTKESHFGLVKNDTNCQKALKQFLLSKYQVGENVQSEDPVNFDLDLQLIIQEKPEKKQEQASTQGKYKLDGFLSEDELVEIDPIIGYILELFDGRVVYGMK